MNVVRLRDPFFRSRLDPRAAAIAAPALTIGEYARRTFWLVTASAACDSRRRREQLCGESACESDRGLRILH